MVHFFGSADEGSRKVSKLQRRPVNKQEDVAPVARKSLEAKSAQLQQPSQSGIAANLERLKLDDERGGQAQKKRTIIPVQDETTRPQTALQGQNQPSAVATSHIKHIGPSNDPYSEAVASRNASHEPIPARTSSRNPASAKAPQPIDLRPRPGADEEFVLGRSEDTRTYVTQAPAVTHETRIVNTHEIVSEQVTREIHNHHIVHRVQPIDEIEVLPARHFVPKKSGNGYVEIDAPRSSEGMEDRIKGAMTAGMEARSTQQRQDKKPDILSQGHRQKKWTSPDGVDCSQSVWVHSPQLDTAARDAGETVPIHVDRPVTNVAS